jgi:hypothetical protein
MKQSLTKVLARTGKVSCLGALLFCVGACRPTKNGAEILLQTNLFMLGQKEQYAVCVGAVGKLK